MKNLLISKLHRAFYAVALVAFSFSMTTAQESFLYEAFSQAWLHPESFDEFVMQNQGQFNTDYYTCADILKEYFRAIYPEEAHQKALCPESCHWQVQSYLTFLNDHPGVGVSTFLSDIENVAAGKTSWLETSSGKASCWLQHQLRRTVFEYKDNYYLEISSIMGEDIAEQYLNEKRMEAYSPFFQYLTAMKGYIQCYYY